MTYNFFCLENEPKLKETTVNYFASRHHWSIEDYTSEKCESVRQYAGTVWASPISSLEDTRYDYLPHRFSLTFQPPQLSLKNYKRSNFQLVFEPEIF